MTFYHITKESQETTRLPKHNAIYKKVFEKFLLDFPSETTMLHPFSSFEEIIQLQVLFLQFFVPLERPTDILHVTRSHLRQDNSATRFRTEVIALDFYYITFTKGAKRFINFYTVYHLLGAIRITKWKLHAWDYFSVLAHTSNAEKMQVCPMFTILTFETKQSLPVHTNIL